MRCEYVAYNPRWLRQDGRRGRGFAALQVLEERRKSAQGWAQREGKDPLLILTRWLGFTVGMQIGRNNATDRCTTSGWSEEICAGVSWSDLCPEAYYRVHILKGLGIGIVINLVSRFIQ